MIDGRVKRPLAAASIIAAGVLASTAALAVKVGPVEDSIGVVKIPKGAPIQIGLYTVLSGPDTALGVDQKRGVEIALDDVGNEVVGHRIRLVTEDSLCTAEGGQTAATKLAANQRIVVVLGPACSGAATPGAPILWKAGVASIGISPGAPMLTDANRKPGYDGFIRVIYNDGLQGEQDAEWIFGEVGCKTAATIHSGDPYTQQTVEWFERRFAELGGTVTASEAIDPTFVEMRPVLTKIATTKPCVIYYPLFVAAGAQVTRQVGEIKGLENTQVIGSTAMMAADFIEAAGDSVVGFRITYPDLSDEAMGKGYPDLVAKYEAKYGEKPIQGYHAHAYDAAKVALMAIEKVAVKDKDGNTYIGRKALRDAIFATKGYDGLSGVIECNRTGDCGTFKYAVYQFTNADPSTFKIGTNPKKIYPK